MKTIKMQSWKRMGITTLGCLILGFGIGLCDHAQLGTDPFTVFLVGLVKTFGGTIGLMNVAVNLVQIAFGYAVDKKMISLVTFAAMFATSIGIDLVGMIFPSAASGVTSSVCFLTIGLLVYAFGTAVAILPNAGYDPYNAFLIGLQKVTSWSYKVVRWIVEIVFLLAGILLGGITGIGTLASFALTGPFVEAFLRLLRHFFPSFGSESVKDQSL